MDITVTHRLKNLLLRQMYQQKRIFSQAKKIITVAYLLT
jgi:hypothetical protein